MNIPLLTAREAANLVQNGDVLGLGGFCPAGSPKAIAPEIANKAIEEHSNGREFKIHLIAGASVGDSCDGTLVRAHAVASRVPFNVNDDMRRASNSGEVKFTDINLSDVASYVRQRLIGPPTWAIIEAYEIEERGDVCRIYLTAGIGLAPTLCRMAEKGVLIELNKWHQPATRSLHDVCEIGNSWERTIIGIQHPLDRIGKPYMEIPTKTIKGIVETDLPDEHRSLAEPNEIFQQMGDNMAGFLSWNIKRGILNPNRLVFQSGVGSGANAVMGAMGSNKEIPDFSIFTEVFQDEPFRLMQEGRVKEASTAALTLTPENLRILYNDVDNLGKKMLVRPSEISNSPEVITRLGVCAMNTAIEVDIYGHVNSTKVCGSRFMNGVGGSLDYTNSAVLSVFSCGSTAKGGAISSIVPFCSHIDHTEHHVDAIVTEYGVADLRGCCARDRVDMLINIAHPDYRPILREYQRISNQAGGHTPHVLSAAFALHDTFLRKGDMRLVDWGDYIK